MLTPSIYPLESVKTQTYMGHVSIVSTAYYLQWIPELAAAASLRLEKHYGHLITGGAA